MIEDLKELWRYRELLISMVHRELKIRYKNSFFGFLWSLVNPLVTVIVMTLVFKYIMGVAIPNYSAYILAAYLPFIFFQMALMDSSQSVINASQLIRKIYFPKEILPLSMIISNFIHMILALLMFFAYLLFIYLRHPQVVPFQSATLLLPVLLLINFCLATGLGFLISALNVFYEDVKYIVGIILYLLFFLCPVMYFSEQVRYGNSLAPEAQKLFYYVYHLNPIAMLVTAYRKILLAPQPVKLGQITYDPLPLDFGLLGIATLVSLFMLWFGYRTFNKLKWRFVERM